MIEMLGVLAIIGVLSVGGIAGYSKAMEMYKMNKVIDEYCKEITNVEKLIAFPLKYVLNGGEYIDQAAVTAYKIMAKKLVGIDL